MSTPSSRSNCLSRSKAPRRDAGFDGYWPSSAVTIWSIVSGWRASSSRASRLVVRSSASTMSAGGGAGDDVVHHGDDLVSGGARGEHGGHAGGTQRVLV